MTPIHKLLTEEEREALRKAGASEGEPAEAGLRVDEEEDD